VLRCDHSLSPVAGCRLPPLPAILPCGLLLLLLLPPPQKTIRNRQAAGETGSAVESNSPSRSPLLRHSDTHPRSAPRRVALEPRKKHPSGLFRDGSSGALRTLPSPAISPVMRDC